MVHQPADDYWEVGLLRHATDVNADPRAVASFTPDTLDYLKELGSMLARSHICKPMGAGDVIDEAVKCALPASVIEAVNRVSELIQLKEAAVSSQDFLLAATFRDQRIALMNELAQMPRVSVERSHVAEALRQDGIQGLDL